MHPLLATFFVVAVLLRVASLAVSRRNERRLREAGAEEHGVGTSNALAGLHTFFYLGCAVEGMLRDAPLDGLALVGMALYALAMTILVWVVTSLGEVWTVRVFLAPDHRLHRGWLFRTFRHPNYFLNLVPELAGLAMALHAWVTPLILLPLYAVFLRKRIAEEERAMAERFPEWDRGGGAA